MYQTLVIGLGVCLVGAMLFFTLSAEKSAGSQTLFSHSTSEEQTSDGEEATPSDVSQ